MQDRMNEEIKRRTRVVRTFPDQESCLRLARAPAAETHEGWLEEHCYLNRGCVRPTCAHPRPSLACPIAKPECAPSERRVKYGGPYQVLRRRRGHAWSEPSRSDYRDAGRIAGTAEFKASPLGYRGHFGWLRRQH